jgi:hypothetical protein
MHSATLLGTSTASYSHSINVANVDNNITFHQSVTLRTNPTISASHDDITFY